jgi:spore maturation protein A
MLNYIWAGLIIISVVFALYKDGQDFNDDRFRNGDALPVQITGLPPTYQDTDDPIPVTVWIDPAQYLDFYKPDQLLPTDAPPGEDQRVREKVARAFLGSPINATLNKLDDAWTLDLHVNQKLPPPLDLIYAQNKDRNNNLQAQVITLDINDTSRASASLKLPNVGFVKVKNVTTVMFDQAGNAVTFAIGLMGVIALWMGLMKIAEDAGLINIFVKLVRPILGPLFPQIPKDHPALGLIAINLAANMLALGNAATPLGIKAMESLQELNKEKDTATNSMVMLLAMNTASVQLLPPVTLIAVMGLAAADLFLPIFLVTLVSLTVAITAAKLLGRMKMFKKTDPMRPNNPNAQNGGAA